MKNGGKPAGIFWENPGISGKFPEKRRKLCKAMQGGGQKNSRRQGAVRGNKQDLILWEALQRVDGLLLPADLEVAVGAGGPAGGAHEGDLLALGYLLPHLDQ